MSEPSPLQSAIAGYMASVMAAFDAYAAAVAEYEATGDKLPRSPFSVPRIPGMPQAFGLFHASTDSPEFSVSIPALCKAIDDARTQGIGEP